MDDEVNFLLAENTCPHCGTAIGYEDELFKRYETEEDQEYMNNNESKYCWTEDRKCSNCNKMYSKKIYS